jgi:hypothetical protein
MEIKISNKNGENLAFFTFHDPRNRSNEILSWQKRVMDFYNIPVNYLEIDYRMVNHGGAIEWVIKTFGDKIDYFTFFDNDCIPTNKNVIDIIYDKIKDKKTIFGGVQNSNHIHENHPIICPSSLSLSSKLYKDLGQPHLGDLIKRSDTCEELVWKCQEQGFNICYVWPKSYYELTPEEMKETGNPQKWNCGNGLYYGMCTQYGDLFFHRGVQNIKRGGDIFIEKCKSILDNKLPDWVSNVKEFLPHKHQDFINDSNENTGHTKQYLYLKELSDKYNGKLILDLGSDCGLSALALGINGQNLVKSYDIVNLYPPEKTAISRKYTNIEYVIENLLSAPERAKKLFKQASLIYLDAGEHAGDIETEFYQLIKESGFTGELVCDDINLNDGMRLFWNNITEEKKVLKDKHWSGTGHVSFVKKELNAVVVSVNCADYLELSLPENIKHFDNYYVGTIATDTETIEICKKYGAIPVICPDPHNINGHKFDKGSCIQECFKQMKNRDSWVLLLDADIILPKDFKGVDDTLDKNVLYGASRSFAWDYNEYLEYKDGKNINNFENIPGGYGCGYFMLFYLNSDKIKNEPLDKIYPNGNIETDMVLLEKFHPYRVDVGKFDFKVLHLGGHSLFENGRIDGLGRFDCVKGKKFKEIPNVKDLLNEN